MGQDQELSAIFDTERALRPSRAVIASTFMWLPLFIAVLGHALGTVPSSIAGRETEWVLLAALVAGWGLTTHQVTHRNVFDWMSFRIPALVAALCAMMIANGGIAIIQNDMRHFVIGGGCLVVAGGLSFNIADHLFPMTNQKNNLARALALTCAVLLAAAAAGIVATFFDGLAGVAFGLYGAIIMLALALLWVTMDRVGRLLFVLIMAAILSNAALIWLYLLGGWSLATRLKKGFIVPPVTFVHISDTHLHHDPTYTGELTDIVPRPGVEAMIQQINELPFPIDFVLHTGDVMTDPEEDAHYAVAQDVLGALRHPVYYLAGNHDRADSIQRMLMGRTTIMPHLDYEFEVNGVQFVCLDSSIPDPDVHYGQLEDAQLAWLESLVAVDDPRPLVVAMHHHALPLAAPWLDRIVMNNGEQLHAILRQARHRLRGVFFGHIHESTVTVRDGISYYSVLSGWFQTRTWYNQIEPYKEPLYYPGFNVVTLTDEDTFVRYYRVMMP